MNFEPLAGFTHEGLLVVQDDKVDLSICPIAISWTGFAANFQIAIEFNKTPVGKRRPYLAVNICGLLIQSGWLF